MMQKKKENLNLSVAAGFWILPPTIIYYKVTLLSRNVKPYSPIHKPQNQGIGVEILVILIHMSNAGVWMYL